MPDEFSLAGFERWIDECELRLDSGDEWQLEPFQREIAADVCAGFRETWVIIPEGNAKTTLMAGLALYFGAHSTSPWIPVGAASRDQAEILFGQAAVFVEQSEPLKKLFRVYEGYRKIKCPGGGRGIKVYASDTRTGDGVIPYPRAFVDELHRHVDLRLYRLWKGKLWKRNAGIITISTAGEPGTEFEEAREEIRSRAKSRKRKGSHLRAEGSELVYHEWMVQDVGRARDIGVVKSANPLAQITTEMLREKLESPTLNFGEDWLRLTCNIPARSSLAAVPEAVWDASQWGDGEQPGELPLGVPVAVGADFAWLLDCTALTPFALVEGLRVFGDPEILTPPRDGTMLDAGQVRDAFHRINERNPIELVVMDPSKAEDIAQWLAHDLGCNVITRTQGNADAAEDYERFMASLGRGLLRHTGHVEFRRHVLNAIARRLPSEKTRFDRPSTARNTRAGRQERRVIDALTAAAMVLSEVCGPVVETVQQTWRPL